MTCRVHKAKTFLDINKKDTASVPITTQGIVMGSPSHI